MINEIKNYSLFALAAALILSIFAGRTIWEISEGYKAKAEQSAIQLSFCVKQNTINNEEANAYEDRISDLDSRVDALRKRVRDDQCIPIPKPTGQSDARADGGYAEPHGIEAGALVDYARDCEQLRQQVIGLQSYIRRSSAP